MELALFTGAAGKGAGKAWARAFAVTVDFSYRVTCDICTCGTYIHTYI